VASFVCFPANFGLGVGISKIEAISVVEEGLSMRKNGIHGGVDG